MNYIPFQAPPGFAGIHWVTPESDPNIVIFRDVPQMSERLNQALGHLASEGIDKVVFDMGTTPEIQKAPFVAEIEGMAFVYGQRTRYVGVTEQDLQGTDPSWRNEKTRKIKPSIAEAVESFTLN